MKRWINQYIKAVIVLFIFYPFLIPTQATAGIGSEAAPFSLPTLSGESRRLQDFRGKVVLLNFWASWCAPCREELPALEKLYQQYQSDRFEVIGINIDKKKKNAAKYTDRFDLSFVVLHDPDAEIIQQYPGRAMPISYLIDPEGIIQNIFFGFNQEKFPEMRMSVKRLLEHKAP